jgi:hypothetical protein
VNPDTFAKTSPTAKYLATRERVLGGMWLHRHPEIAAGRLVELLGPSEAHRWALALLDEIEAAR